MRLVLVYGQASLEYDVAPDEPLSAVIDVIAQRIGVKPQSVHLRTATDEVRSTDTARGLGLSNWARILVSVSLVRGF